jgi:cytochrome b561
MSTLRSDGSTLRYTRVAILLHWLVAGLVVAQFTWGWWMQSIAKTPPGVRADAFNLHKSVGLVILALMLVRLGWRLAHPPPPLDGLPRWQRLLARATHALLYVALLVMPLAGYLGSVFSGYPVKWFGVTLPAWGWKDTALKDLMSTVHLATSFVLASAVLLHVAGSLKHALDGDGWLRRMGLPQRRRVATGTAVAQGAARGARARRGAVIAAVSSCRRPARSPAAWPPPPASARGRCRARSCPDRRAGRRAPRRRAAHAWFRPCRSRPPTSGR